MNKYAKITAAAAMASVMLLSSCGMNYDKSRTVMTVGKLEFTENEYNYLYTSLKNNGTTEGIQDEVLSRMEVTLLSKEVAQAKGTELSDSDKDSIKTTMRQMTTEQGGKKSYKKFLKEAAVSNAFMENLVECNLYMMRLRQEDNYVTRVTDEQAREFFNENYRRAKHILILVDSDATDEQKAEKQAQADEIFARAQAGEDFDKMVSEFSEDPGSETNPDGYYFSDGEMVPEFQATVDSLQPGEIGMCTSDYGIHIIKRYDLEEGSDAYNDALTAKIGAVRQGAAGELFTQALKSKAEELGIETTIDEEVLASLEK